MTPERKEKKRATARKWYAKNKARVRAQQRAYYAADPARRKEATKKWQSDNREKVREGNRAWVKANPEKHRKLCRESQRRRKGVPVPTRACPAVCELCGNPPRKKILAVDHDHATGKFRGWLCWHCNTALGKFGDNLAGVQLALNYLNRAKK